MNEIPRHLSELPPKMSSEDYFAMLKGFREHIDDRESPEFKAAMAKVNAFHDEMNAWAYRVGIATH